MLTVIDPTSGKVLHEYPADDKAAVEHVLNTSDAAFKSWRKTTFKERAGVLTTVARHMRDHVETLAPLMTAEMGKPIKEARAEVLKAAWCAEHYAENAESYLAKDVIPSDATSSYVQYLPLGPIMGVLPWNAPFWLAFRFCAPALMAGNTCVMKHDSHVPACSRAIEGLFDKVGAPKGIFQSLLIQTPDVEAVIRDDRIRAVSFTGEALSPLLPHQS